MVGFEWVYFSSGGVHWGGSAIEEANSSRFFNEHDQMLIYFPSLVGRTQCTSQSLLVLSKTYFPTLIDYKVGTLDKLSRLIVNKLS